MFSWLDDNIQELIRGNKLQRAGLPGRILVVVLRFLYAMMRDFFSGASNVGMFLNATISELSIRT